MNDVDKFIKNVGKSNQAPIEIHGAEQGKYRDTDELKVTGNDVQFIIFAIIVLALIFVFGLFVVGFDQGHIFSVVLGEQAYEDLYIHELTHDMRHAAGFPCH